MLTVRRVLALFTLIVLVAVPLRPPAAHADAPGAKRAGSWAPMSEINAPSPRFDHQAVWTGKELLIWGGFGTDGDLGDGARYDPATDTWRPISMTDAPSPRSGHTAVWTGQELIVWGGYGGPDGHPHVLADGARYDPSSDTWTPLPPVALAARVGHSAVWTGKEMIVWGGQFTGFTATQLGTRVLGDGAAYNPTTNSWRLLSSVGAPVPMSGHVAVWTGTDMLVWGTSTRYALAGPVTTEQGGRYDPATDTWQPLPTIGAPPNTVTQVGMWTGQDLLIWGQRFDPASNKTTVGGRYDPGQNAWTPMSLHGGPGARWRESAVWTGREMLIWGGWNSPPTFGDGAAYDPATDTWRPILASGAPSPRAGQSATWTGTQMIVWGGFSAVGFTTQDLGDGARYTPPSPGVEASGVPAVVHDERYFPETGFRIDNDIIWDYFQRRGSVATFGYPTSRTFVFQGFLVQFFQRRIVQLDAVGQARILNLLDVGLLPYSTFNGSTFPSADGNLLASAPSPTDATATLAFVQRHAPDVVDGVPVKFFQTFLHTVPLAAAFPSGSEADALEALLPGLDLEQWGLPTSAPAVDPHNHSFIYLRWQRGIMMYDASCNCTQGVLLADYLKAVIRAGSDLPRDLWLEADHSPLYAQYCPGAPHWLCRPAALPATDLTDAFEPA